MSQRRLFHWTLGLFSFITLAYLFLQLYLPGTSLWPATFLKLLIIPLIIGAFAGGLKGGLFWGALSSLVYLLDLLSEAPDSSQPIGENLLGALIFIAAGVVLGVLSDLERKTFSLAKYKEKKTLLSKKKTVRDPLTQTFNRTFMEKFLKEVWSHARQGGGSFCLLKVDINGFKTINEQFGYSAGDRVLKSTAQTLFNQTRATDHIFRYGGDEFLLLLQDCPRHAALSLAKRLRQEMAKLTFSHQRLGFKADFCVGIIEYQKKISRLSEMLAGLDEALYRAKQLEEQVVLAG